MKPSVPRRWNWWLKPARTAWQVVQEFLNVATHKAAVPLTLKDSKTVLEQLLLPLLQVLPNAVIYQEALGIAAETGYSFYDSLILAAADFGECRVVYSEDLQHGQRVRGMRILNPFLE